MKKELTVLATVENMETVTDFVNEYLEEIDCPMKAQMQIAIVIDEIFSNIAYYAYGTEVGDATVGVDFKEDSKMVILTFSDGGRKYNPLEKEDPDITLSAEERQIGGMGIFMVKKLVDELLYEYVDEKNVLTVCKKI